MTDEEYNASQLDRVTVDEDNKRILKIAGFHSETKWLTITPLQFDMIRAVLTTPAPVLVPVPFGHRLCHTPTVHGPCLVVVAEGGVCDEAGQHI